MASVVVVDSPQSYDGLPRGRWPNENMPCKLDGILHFKSNSTPKAVYLPGVYPYPELLLVLYTSATNTRGTGTVFSYLPETSVSSVRSCHNTRGAGTACFVPARNFCGLCNTSVYTRTRKFWMFCKTPIPSIGNPQTLQNITFQNYAAVARPPPNFFALFHAIPSTYSSALFIFTHSQLDQHPKVSTGTVSSILLNVPLSNFFFITHIHIPRPRCSQAEMDHLLGPDATGYLSPPALEVHEGLCREGALGVFDAMATMGRRSEILRVRALLLDELDEAHVRCVTRALLYVVLAYHDDDSWYIDRGVPS